MTLRIGNAQTEEYTTMLEGEKYDKVKTHILEVSRRIFSKFGFRKTTMDDIAQAAQKGKSTLYYYFRNKEAVFQGVVEKEARILKSKLLYVVSEELDGKSKLKKYIQTRIYALRELANFYDALQNEYLNHLAFIEHIREKYDREEITLIKMMLIEGIDRNEFEIPDVEAAAEAILVALKGLEMPLFMGKTTIVEQENRLDNVLRVLYYGISKQ